MLASRYDRSPAITSRARGLRRDVSKTEFRLWPHLRSSRMGAPFRRQHPVGPYFADCCCAPLKLIVEVDGPLHDAVRDASRDAFLASRGFEVLRFTVEDLDERLNGVVEAIFDAVQMRLAAKSDRTK